MGQSLAWTKSQGPGLLAIEDFESFEFFIPCAFMPCLQSRVICSMQEGWRLIFPVLSLEFSFGTELTGDWAEVDARMANPPTVRSLSQTGSLGRGFFGSHVLVRAQWLSRFLWDCCMLQSYCFSLLLPCARSSKVGILFCFSIIAESIASCRTIQSPKSATVALHDQPVGPGPDAGASWFSSLFI